MRRKLIATVSMAAAAALAVGSGAAPAVAAPSSPGACHMMLAAPQGVIGMHGASEQGFGNMIDLLDASFEAGCSL